MSMGSAYDRCLSFINCQIAPAAPGRAEREPAYRAITLSRQGGSGAHAVAEQLAARLRGRTRDDRRPWTVFDKELMQQVLKDHDLPERMVEFIPEDRRTELQDAVEELFGLRPPSWTLIQHTTETILRLVELGNVILIGRASNVVTLKNPEVLHVRLVGSEEQRAERMARARNVHRKAALETLRQEDRGRARYVKKYFQADVEDPLLYHLTLNTDLLPPEQVVDLLDRLVQGEAAPAKP